MKFDERGREIPDPTPVEMPLGWQRPEPLADLIRRVIRQEASQAAQAAGMETFEEADDFDVGDDDPLPFSPHELTEMQEEFKLEPVVNQGDENGSGDRGGKGPSASRGGSGGGASGGVDAEGAGKAGGKGVDSGRKAGAAAGVEKGADVESED